MYFCTEPQGKQVNIYPILKLRNDFLKTRNIIHVYTSKKDDENNKCINFLTKF